MSSAPHPAEVGPLLDLQYQGASTSIVRGKIRVVSADGETITPALSADDRMLLSLDIAQRLAAPIYRYTGYTVGPFGEGGRFPGVCLQFQNIATGHSYPVCFNAKITRARNSRHGKAGDRLPAKQFRVGRLSAFVRFWVNAGLPLPPRLSAFHDYMGKLQDIIFLASLKPDGSLDKTTLTPFSLDEREVWALTESGALPDRFPSSPPQLPYNGQTSSPDKHLTEHSSGRAIERESTAGASHRETKVNKETEEVKIMEQNKQTPSDPRGQSREEWLQSYDNRESLQRLSQKPNPC